MIVNGEHSTTGKTQTIGVQSYNCQLPRNERRLVSARRRYLNLRMRNMQSHPQSIPGVPYLGSKVLFSVEIIKKSLLYMST